MTYKDDAKQQSDSDEIATRRGEETAWAWPKLGGHLWEKLVGVHWVRPRLLSQRKSLG